MDRARIPAPAGRSVVPIAIVIWRPAPRLIAEPTPAVVIDPDPAAIAVWRPVGRHARAPDLAVARIVHPLAVRIQILGAVYIGTHVLITARALQGAVAAVVPVIPGVAR